MNKLFSILLLALAAATSPGLALTADQKITAVTVYPDRALVTRSGTVKLESGVQSVVFDNLPCNLEEDSVRAKAQGNLKILGVEVRRDYKEVIVSAATKQLQDDATKLDDQIRTLTDEESDLQRRNDFLDQIRDKVTSQVSAGDGKEQTNTVQNIQGLFQLYAAETTKITNRRREIEFAVRDLNKQRATMASQLSLLQQPATPNSRSAIVTVEADDAGPADLQVSYLIPGASWVPQYDAYADPETQKVELTNYGVVRQATGEDWTDVDLTLSSARPSTAARMPELPAWTVDFGSNMALEENMDSALRQNRVVLGQAVQVSANFANNSADAPVLAPVASPVEAELQTAQVRSLGPVATFVVPAKTSIPGDNQPHRNAISIQSLKGEWTYEMTPKLVSSAFLKTRVTNASGGPLLGGEINTFLGNNFIGKSNIGLVAANASFDLYLGVDENIKVTRTEGVKKEETGGLISRLKLYKRSFTIEVQNFKTTDASFKIHDQLPVSRNGQINVVVDKAEPDFQSQDKDTGKVTWEIKLKPNEKQKINVEYEIDAPYEQAVAGI